MQDTSQACTLKHFSSEVGWIHELQLNAVVARRAVQKNQRPKAAAVQHFHTRQIQDNHAQWRQTNHCVVENVDSVPHNSSCALQYCHVSCLITLDMQRLGLTHKVLQMWARKTLRPAVARVIPTTQPRVVKLEVLA